MERQNDLPPTQTIRPMDAPPDSRSPTTAQLKADIDSGRTGDKIPHVDVGAAPLGTCDEAGGTPPTPQRVRLARLTERAPSEKAAAGVMQQRTPWITPAYAGAIVAIAAVLAIALWLTH